MKFRLDSRYFSGAVYAFGVVMVTVLWAMILLNGDLILSGISTAVDICKPLIYGFCFAYILYPAESRVERLLEGRFRRPHPKLSRALGVTVTVICLLVLLTLLFAVIVPQISTGYSDLKRQIEGYLSDSSQWLDTFLNDKLKLNFMLPTAPRVVKLPVAQRETVPDLLFRTVAEAQGNGVYQALTETLSVDTRISVSSFLQQQLSGLYEYLETLTPTVLSFAVTVLNEAKNILIGLIVAVYLLLSRERCILSVRRFFRGLLPRTVSGKLFRVVRRINGAFFHFITDKLMDAMVMFAVYFFALSVFRIPYAPLVSTIMALSNLVPYVGPLACAVPAVFIVFVASPADTLWFLLIAAVVQGLDLYLIEAKLLGNRSMLSPAWVLIAVCLMWGLFGLPGLLIAVPLASVVHTQVQSSLGKRLEKKGMAVDTESYLVGSRGGNRE